VDLFGGGVGTWVCTILGGDEYPPELAEHVLVAGVSFGGVPAGAIPVVSHDGGVVAGQVVPDDHQALGEQAERDGALDGQPCAVAGFTDAGDVFSVGEGDLGGSAGGVAVPPADWPGCAGLL